ncbi:MAG TPA: limonene-1,2-epoxide hydrolase family protein [Steroidobacteraceae bacterium]|nr:limonene-1,2-epoxide hydrolase family protein [Steroidobacteraceae bacterium]
MAANHEQTIRQFMSRWGIDHETMIAAFEKYMAPDCLWEQDPIPTTRTLDEAVGLLRDFNAKVGLETIVVEIRTVAATGNVVFVERTDFLKRKDGSLIVQAPVTGVFELDSQGKIKAWREYFDSATLMAAMAPR